MAVAVRCGATAARGVRRALAARARGASASPLRLPAAAPGAPALRLRRAVLVAAKSESGDAAVAAADAAEKPAPPAEKPKKPRLPALDSIRFFLIAYISIGHFIGCATKDQFLLWLFGQVNVVVGAFFVLSGYVAGYTGTLLNEYKADKRVQPAGAYIVSRIAGYYPLYFLVNVLFLPMFVFADVTYNGWLKTAWHGLLTFTLSQAWFPKSAELWNAPTWFLSAFTVCQFAMPWALPAIAAMKKRGLQIGLVVLTVIACLVKIAYSYDLNCWTIFEGMTPPKLHPNHVFWNVVRFNPFNALVEVLMGVFAARILMTENVKADGSVEPEQPVKGGSPVVPLVGMLALILYRALGWVSLNDGLARSFIFIPLFTIFLMRLHRETVNGGEGRSFKLSAVMAWKPLVYLGTISFPIYIIHGPLGQLFYKKVVATKVFGFTFIKFGMPFFICWLGIVLVAAMLLHHLFVTNKSVGAFTKETVGKVVKALPA